MRIKKKNLIFEERIKADIIIPKEVLELYNIFKKNNFKLYLVGGAVRDSLMSNPIKDYDLATDALPNVVEKMLIKNGIKVIGTGEAFGVMNAFIGDNEYEIATFRSDNYSDSNSSRNPTSVTYSNIETDVKRRDLTINALFYDIGTREIVDLVGGVEDIKNGVVRAVGNAKERFNEDPLRILRAIRFAARVGSTLDLDIDTVLKVNNSLDGVSGERIRDEFIKGVKSAKSSVFYLSLLNKYGLFDWIFRGLSPINTNFIESNNELLVITTLLKNIEFSVISKELNKLKYPTDEVKQIVFMISFVQSFSKGNFYTLKKLHIISKVPDKIFREFVKDDILVNKFIKFNFSFGGDEVMKRFGIKAGPNLGNKIRELETNEFYNS